MKIKALLLSAGIGSRLRPITLTTPKCLVEVNGIPILERWLKILEKNRVNSVLINKNYLYEKVEKFLAENNNFDMNIIQTFEKKLLGTAGTLIANSEFFKDSLGLLIHCDNFTDFNLKELIESHKNKPNNCLLTMLTFNTNNPSSCGIIEVDKNNVVKSFYEKNPNPPGNLANGAIYVFDYSFVNWIKNNFPTSKDFSTEIIPNLIGKIYVHQTESIFIDIGTKENLELANKLSINAKY